jgi:hypothetical protein
VPFVADSDLVRQYGASEAPAEFGGVFFEGPVLVALFTDGLERHLAALRDLLHEPELLSVRLAARPWSEVQHSKDAVAQALLHPRRHPAVWTVGIMVVDGQFAVSVGISPYGARIAREVREAVAPHAIVVQRRGPVRPRYLVGEAETPAP